MRADRLKSIIADVDTEHDPRVQIGLCLMMLPPGLTFRVKQNKDIEATSGVRDEGGRRQVPMLEYSGNSEYKYRYIWTNILMSVSRRP